MTIVTTPTTPSNSTPNQTRKQTNDHKQFDNKTTHLDNLRQGSKLAHRIPTSITGVIAEFQLIKQRLRAQHERHTT
jgi:hypothetical protein